MPLYECEQCHCVENTALTNFWEAYMERTAKLCSECDPRIGRWHGRFPKQPASEYLKEFPGEKIDYPAVIEKM